jgi:hypothetical protein
VAHCHAVPDAARHPRRRPGDQTGRHRSLDVLHRPGFDAGVRHRSSTRNQQDCDPARRCRGRRSGTVRRLSARCERRGDDALRRVGAARAAHGRAGPAQPGARARTPARRWCRRPIRHHQAAQPGSQGRARARQRASLQPHRGPSNFPSASANGSGRPESTRVSPAASTSCSSGLETAPEARRSDTAVTPTACNACEASV